MHNGLGRTGYVLLAFVLFALGALGLAAAYYAHIDQTVRFFAIGLGLAAFSLLGLFGFAALAPWLARPSAAPHAETRPEAAQAQTSAPSTEQATGPAVAFEYRDVQPAAKAAPETLVLPNAFGQETPAGAAHARDPTSWPERRGKSDWSARQEHRNKVEQMVEESPVRKEMTERYTRTTPTVRGIMQEPPLLVAERAPPGVEPGFAAPGMSVGQCGRCATVVMAPEQRPIRLKCPQCAKVTLLN